MTEEIINALARIPQLEVTSRTSSFFFKNNEYSLSEIGTKLQVDNILEGSVRLGGNMLRITAQLIHVSSDSHYWSETWDRPLENIFEVQDEISLSIADKLRESFGHMDIEDHLALSPTQNIHAYQCYLKGRHLFNKWNPEAVNKAIGYFEMAVNQDQQLIEAHTGLADGYSFLAVAGFAPREQSWQKAIQSLEIAKKIDPEDATLNYLLANQAFFTEANFSDAMRFTQVAISSKPTHPEAQQFITFLYILCGEMDKAYKHLQYARAVDPLNQETKFYEAYYAYRDNEYYTALTILQELLQDNPNNLPALVTSLYVQIKSGEAPAAERIIKYLDGNYIMPDEKQALLCLALIFQGKEKDARPLIDKLEKNAVANTSHQADSYLFMIYAALSMNNEAFNILEKLFTKKSSILLLAFGDPLADRIQSDSRYQKYLNKIFSTQQISLPRKTQKSPVMEDRTAKSYLKKLDRYILEEKPYLNPVLTLRGLAERIEIHPNQLSWLLNEQVGKNFNEFVNMLRVEHFKELVVNPKNHHISLIGLAYESGFNSKTVFNTVFKKLTGMTPKEYQKKSGPSDK
jgi:AraC-like DNA-binding protein